MLPPPAALTVEFDREEDGRWIADIPECPGALAYGATQREAATKAYAIALRVLAARVELGEMPLRGIALACP